MSRKNAPRLTRRLIGVAALAGLSLLTATSARAANVSAVPLAAQDIKADSAQFTVFGVTLNQAAAVDSLTGVRVRFTSSIGFTTGDLAADFTSGGCANGDATSCDGVQMFRDNGNSDEALDSLDTPVSTGYSFFSTNCTVGCDADLTLTGSVPIPLSSVNEGYTFLIAIRTGAISNGDSFTVSLQPTAFTTTPTPTLMGSVVTTDPITADTVAPVAPVVTGLGLSRAAGRVHVSTPAVSSAETTGDLQVYSSGSETCSSPTLEASSGGTDLTRTHDDLLSGASEDALRAFPSAKFACYRIVDLAGNASSFVSDGQLPAAPSAANVALVGSSNVTGSKAVAAAPDTASRTMRMYIRPGGSGDWVRARNEDAVTHDEWIEVTTSTTQQVCSVNPPSTTACTTDIRRYDSDTQAGPTLAAADGVGYTLVNANGNEGDVMADGVVPAAPVAGDTGLLRVSAADGHQRLTISGGTPGAAFGLYMDTTGLGTDFRRAVNPSGALVTVTATGGQADSGTTEIRSQTGSGTVLTAGHAIAYVAIGAGGNLSNFTAESTIPAAPATGDTSFSDAANTFRWNPAVPPAATQVRLFAGADAASAYGTGAGLGTAADATPVTVAEQNAGLNLFYTATNTTSGHESPAAADGSIPAAPDTTDIGILSTSAAAGHQRTIATSDASAPRTFRLYVDTAGASTWVQASTTSGGSTPVDVTTSSGSATSGGTPGAQSIFAGVTQLAGSHSVGFARTSGGNDSDVATDGAIPAAPPAADGAVSDAANTFTFASASVSYRVNMHLGGAADTAALAYSPSGPDATSNSTSAVAIADPANDATIFYTATNPASGNESPTTADGAIPAAPNATDSSILSVSAVSGAQRLRADADVSGPRTFRLFLDPAGGSNWQTAVTTSGGSSPVEVTTSSGAPMSSPTTSAFAGAQQIDAGFAVGYGRSNANGHASEVQAEATVPVAADVSTASATAAVDKVTMTGIPAGRTVRVFAHASAGQAAAYAAGAKATLTTAAPTQSMDTDGGWGVFYTSTADVSGHESPITADGTIPAAIDRLTTEASDAFNRFTLPGATATDNVLIIMSSQSSAANAYDDAGATRYTATASPFLPGVELDPLFVYYTVKNTGSGNESAITTAGSVPAAPSGADTTMAASAALGRITSALDSSQRTLRLYLDVDGAGASPFERAVTTSDGSTAVQIVTSTSAEVSSAPGIFAGSAALTSGHSVAYSRVLEQNESDLVTDGSVPASPAADAFTASAADQQATIAASAATGTYRVFRGAIPASDKRSHTNGAATVVSTSGLLAGDLLGYAMSNANGNESPLLADGSIPSVSTPDLQAASDTGVSATDNVTKLAAPVVDVTTDPAASVLLFEGGTQRGGPQVADGAGLATISSSALSEGAHALTATATKDGNTSPLSGALSVTVDLTAPAAPSAAPDLDASSDTGDVATDNLTNDATPSLNVVGAANGSVTIKEGATALGTGATDGSGAGQATSSALSEGVHTIVATTSDTAGNESGASPSLAITIDLTGPSVPGVPDLQAGSDSNIANDDITNDVTPAFDVSGAEASVTIGLRDFGSDVGSVASGAGGTVTVTSSALTEGAHSFSAVAIDAAGNVSAASAALGVQVDTIAPVVPGVPDLLAASDSGSSSSDDLTNDATPALVSAGNESGVTVAFVEGASTLASATADGAGDAGGTASSLADGAHGIAASASDVAGNISAASSALTVTVDTAAPAVLAAAPDLVAASDSGSSSTDGITNDATPVFAISGAEAGAAVALVSSTSTLGTGTADGSGDASVTSNALTDATYAVVARLTDAAGNVSADSPAASVTIDTVAPTVPAAPDLLAASDSNISTDDITNDATPDIRVQGTDANVTASLIKSSATVASGSTSPAGLIDLGVTPALSDGSHQFTASATDVAGNVSTESAALTVTVDTVVPAAPAKPVLLAGSDSGSSNSDAITNDATPDILVAGEANAVLAVLDGATERGSRTGDGMVTLSSLADGSRSLTAKATDVAGNVSPSSAALTVKIDTVAPTVALTPPSSLLGTATAVFTENVGSVSAAQMLIRLDAARPAPSRAPAPATSTVIYDAASKTAGLSLGKALMPGEYYELVMTGGPADAAGNVSLPATVAFRGSLVQEEITLAGAHFWRVVGGASGAFGGSYVTERTGGARASMVFTGSEITWYTVTGPGQGMAHVYIDGTYMGLFNNYAAGTTHRVARRFAGLSATPHTILIIVDGRKGASSAVDTQVAVDAFQILYPTGLRATLTAPPMTYLWRINNAPNASGGRYILSDQAGALVSFTFRGTKLAWYPVFGPSNGRARVYIDNVDKGVVDLYSAGSVYNSLRFFGGLSDGVHSVKIISLGQRRAASRGNNVMTDRYAIG